MPSAKQLAARAAFKAKYGGKPGTKPTFAKTDKTDKGKKK